MGGAVCGAIRGYPDLPLRVGHHPHSAASGEPLGPPARQLSTGARTAQRPVPARLRSVRARHRGLGVAVRPGRDAVQVLRVFTEGPTEHRTRTRYVPERDASSHRCGRILLCP